MKSEQTRVRQLPTALLRLCAPTISTGPCPLTVAGPLAAWMPPRSLQGRTCSVSCDGGRARALQQNARSRGRGALTARRTRREPVHGGSMAASMPPPVPQSARTPHQIVRWWFLKSEQTRPDSCQLLCCDTAHRPSRLVLARSPSQDPWRHGCRHGAYRDVLAACPAMVGGQGPCSTHAASSAPRPHRSQDTP